MVMTEEPVLSQHVEQESVAGLTKLRRRAQGMNVAHALTTRRSVEVDVYQHNKPITQLILPNYGRGRTWASILLAPYASRFSRPESKRRSAGAGAGASTSLSGGPIGSTTTMTRQMAAHSSGGTLCAALILPPMFGALA